MKITKAIIATAGWGTRRLPITKTIEKSMLPVGNRPAIDYIVKECAASGITDIYIVIDEKAHSQIEDYYSPNPELEEYLTVRGKEDQLSLIQTRPDGVNLYFVPQFDLQGRYGTAAPIAQVVEKYNITEPTAVIMGDDFTWSADGTIDLARLIDSIQDDSDSALLAVEIPPQNVSRYGVLRVEDGLLTGIVEKPTVEAAPSNLINISKYIMSSELLARVVEYYNSHHFGPRDQEYMITDPIATHIEAGGKIRVLPAAGEYLDCGTLEGWLHANNTVLKS